jgi:hypothetical protein
MMLVFKASAHLHAKIIYHQLMSTVKRLPLNVTNSQQIEAQRRPPAPLVKGRLGLNSAAPVAAKTAFWTKRMTSPASRSRSRKRKYTGTRPTTVAGRMVRCCRLGAHPICLALAFLAPNVSGRSTNGETVKTVSNPADGPCRHLTQVRCQ